MKAPIPSPWGDDLPRARLSKRVEWYAERECFRLRYFAPFWGMMRCEIRDIPRKRSSLLLFTVGLPLVLPTTLFIMATQCFKQPGEFLVYDWGLADNSTGTTFSTKWENLTRVALRNGDLLLERDAAHSSNDYQCREDFADEAEAARLQNIIESLRARNGANWEEVVRQFRT